MLGRTYVFVHGSPSDRRVWEDVVALAPRGTTSVVLDLPDHGDAPADLTASMEPLEEALIEAVEATSGDVTVVGHSMGAWLVAATSARMPERVTRFVAISGMSRYDDAAVKSRRDLLVALEAKQLEPSAVREAILALFFGELRSSALEARVSAMLELSREHWARLVRRALEINQRPPAYFARPAMVIHATGDAGIPFSLGQELARLSGCELVTIDTGSHMVQLTHARELAELIFARS
jgi:pimeloyl-ACP methyl ester carboxylesterase